MMQHIQYETLRAAHWTGCVWPLYHDVLQTVLCIALPEKKIHLSGLKRFYSCGSMSREGERVKKIMTGGRQVALIINHLVRLSSTFRLLLVSRTWPLLL